MAGFFCEASVRADVPGFDSAFREKLIDLFVWRRDVRRFRDTPVSAQELEALLRLVALSPSVGNSQPWRFVLVEDHRKRDDIVAEFERCNRDALASYQSERATAYARLKLEGLREAPAVLAVFCDESCPEGHGLGRRTMPETLRYSVVMAIHTFWLAARAQGLGVGWVSILDPDRLPTILDVPERWSFVACLCVGYPHEEHLDPELVRHGWQDRRPVESFFYKR